MIRSKMIVPVAIIAAVGAGLAVNTQLASAQDIPDVHQSIVTRLAQKFNLQESEVKAVFDEEHKVREEEMKKELAERLSAAVKEGKITDGQKTAIENKLEEMRSQRPDHIEWKDMDGKEKRVVKFEMKEEMEKWAAENGLTLETFHEIVGFGGKGHFMMKIKN